MESTIWNFHLALAEAESTIISAVVPFIKERRHQMP
ncbi:hypothetical protein SCG7086_AL_00070 [Chlamydiales bacterium SCGC AG-110-P3]|nr:hypothetical protein SCG7086_AL_00070 [Chlamydiales bacterium SCGC AG-110-P3]